MSAFVGGMDLRCPGCDAIWVSWMATKSIRGILVWFGCGSQLCIHETDDHRSRRSSGWISTCPYQPRKTQLMQLTVKEGS